MKHTHFQYGQYDVTTRERRLIANAEAARTPDLPPVEPPQPEVRNTEMSDAEIKSIQSVSLDGFHDNVNKNVIDRSLAGDGAGHLQLDQIEASIQKQFDANCSFDRNFAQRESMQLIWLRSKNQDLKLAGAPYRFSLLGDPRRVLVQPVERQTDSADSSNDMQPVQGERPNDMQSALGEQKDGEAARRSVEAANRAADGQDAAPDSGADQQNPDKKKSSMFEISEKDQKQISDKAAKEIGDKTPVGMTQKQADMFCAKIALSTGASVAISEDHTSFIVTVPSSGLEKLMNHAAAMMDMMSILGRKDDGVKLGEKKPDEQKPDDQKPAPEKGGDKGGEAAPDADTVMKETTGIINKFDAANKDQSFSVKGAAADLARLNELKDMQLGNIADPEVATFLETLNTLNYTFMDQDTQKFVTLTYEDGQIKFVDTPSAQPKSDEQTPSSGNAPQPTAGGSFIDGPVMNGGPKGANEQTPSSADTPKPTPEPTTGGSIVDGPVMNGRSSGTDK